MTHPTPTDVEADWLDALVRHGTAEPRDDGFSTAVLQALPSPVPKWPARRTMRWVNAGALVAGTLLAVGLLPQTVDVLAGSVSAPHGAWDLALPAFAVLGWLSWWSWRQAFLAD